MEKCSICNSNNLVSRDWGGIECLTCFSIIPKKIPSEIEIINHYSSDLNTSDYYHKEALKGDKLIRYANWYLKLIRKYILHGKLFDIGSGVTPFPQLAFKNGFKTTSGDIK